MAVIMVGTEACRKCRQAQAVLKQRGLWPEIEYVDADSDRGGGLAAAYNQDKLPFYILDGKAYVYTGKIMRLLEERREAGG